MQLIDDARRAWRMFSVQMMLAAGTLQAIWTQYGDQLRPYLPAKWVSAITLILLLLGIFGRLVKQPKATPVATAKIAAGEAAPPNSQA
jgi:hypothetical protein